MSVQYASGAVAFADFLDRVKARLLAVLAIPGTDPEVAVDESFVRVILEQDLSPPGAEYRPEAGVTILVGPLVPDERCGAGRVGWKVHRDVEVWVVSGASLLDRAGDSSIGLRAHMTLEDKVIDAIVDAPPAALPNSLYQSLLCTWVPGGKPPRRQDGTDYGLIQSSHVFRCEYTAKLRTDRS